ncbi:MAG: HNH endonuclease [Chloroflexi bacterium]|jgi:hypothetical protein|nr:HNH endonuclease [Chloroflexota bacterium]
MPTEKQLANWARMRGPDGIGARNAAKASAAAAERYRANGPSAAQSLYRGGEALRERLARVRPPLDPAAGAKAGWAKVRAEGPSDAQRAAWKANGARIAALNRTPERIAAARIRRANPRVIGECYACWGPATAMDHLVPRSRGGIDDPENRAPICDPCNASKSSRTVEEWLDAGLRGAGPVVNGVV